MLVWAFTRNVFVLSASHADVCAHVKFLECYCIVYDSNRAHVFRSIQKQHKNILNQKTINTVDSMHMLLRLNSNKYSVVYYIYVL